MPKVDGPGAIMAAARTLREAGAPDETRIWAMMETPNAILNAGSIASVAADPSSRLAVMVMGLNDLAKETRARLTPGRPTMTAWLAACVVAARAHGVDILDGVYNDIQDLEGFRLECLQGRDMGLDGKTLIHPSQVDICNEVFAPTNAEVESAAAIIEAFALPENAGKGVIQLNGRMVELLHADMARRTLAIATRSRREARRRLRIAPTTIDAPAFRPGARSKATSPHRKASRCRPALRAGGAGT